ncbi:MAG: hypothetical protein ACK4IX_12415 [Candidatus Sericytochromatia bacterium]
MKKTVLFGLFSILLLACQVEEVQQVAPSTTYYSNPSPSSSSIVPSSPAVVVPSTTINSSVKPSATTTPPPKTTGDTDTDEKLDPNDQEEVKLDTEVQKTNVDWKVYNPVVKGKKYTYAYTIKEGTSSSTVDILREISEIKDKAYVLKQTFVSSSKENQLSAINITVALNSDNSPAIIPVISVGGEKVEVQKEVQVFDKPEKLKVLFGEFDSVKVITKATTSTDTTTTTNWYGKNTGLIKSVQESKAGTYTLELKNYL